jgi:wyosine [tRNA(Phe)-imidazoG37] synthetase (radical SAM superfamily)
VSIIFGPIHSRRFGKSLGIDLSPNTKQCNYDCLYCELASTQTVNRQSESVPLETVAGAISNALARHTAIDVLTITANGEPTLYPWLDELIDHICAIKGYTRTLILSNGSTIADPAIQQALRKIDTVKLSLDCATPRCFKRIDRHHNGIDLGTIMDGMLAFRARYTGALIIEILVVKGINDTRSQIQALSAFLTKLHPDRIDLGTIDRPPAYRVDPISYDRLYQLAHWFDPALPIHITHRKTINLTPENYSDSAILATLAKRPLTPEDVAILFDTKSQERLKTLIAKGQIVSTQNNGVTFFKKSDQNH